MEGLHLGPTRQDSYFLSPFMLKTREMAYPAPTKGRSKLSPNAAMLFAPFGCTHPPPLAPPFLLAQSPSLKDIAGCDIMKLKVSRCRYATLGLKGFNVTGTLSTYKVMLYYAVEWPDKTKRLTNLLSSSVLLVTRFSLSFIVEELLEL